MLHLIGLFPAAILSLIRVFGLRAGALPFFDHRLCCSSASTITFVCVCYSTKIRQRITAAPNQLAQPLHPSPF
jgi:hypothetical protein